MIKHLYVIMDKVSGLYSDPMADALDAQHIKASYIASARAGKISEDAEFCVYEIGSFDDVNGTVLPSLKETYVVGSKELFAFIKAAPKKEEVNEDEESLQAGE